LRTPFSNNCSAGILLNHLFSASSPLSRSTPGTLMPPNLLRRR